MPGFIPRQNLSRLLAFAVLVALPTLLICLDFYRFSRTALDQAWLALKDGKHLLPEPVENEAIVVLTGDTRRIPKAIELLRLRRSPVLLISGAGKGATLTNLVNQQGQSAGNIQEVWNRIIVESESQSTVENARFTKKILTGKQVQRVILVTSDYHMWRAAQIFRQVYPEVDYYEFPVPSTVADLALFPSSSTKDASEGVWRLLLEYLKTVLFRLNRFRGAL